MIIVILISLLSCLAGCWIAGGKGRFFSGALLGLLLGPIGIIICFFLPADPNFDNTHFTYKDKPTSGFYQKPPKL